MPTPAWNRVKGLLDLTRQICIIWIWFTLLNSADLVSFTEAFLLLDREGGAMILNTLYIWINLRIKPDVTIFHIDAHNSQHIETQSIYGEWQGVL